MTVGPRAPATRARRHERRVEASGIGRRGALVIAVAVLMTASVGLGPAVPSASGASSSAVATASFPTTPAGKQAKWLFNAVLHHPIPAGQIAAHFDTAYLSTLPAPAATTLNASFAGITRLQLDGITTSTPGSIQFVVTVNATSEQQVNIAVDAHGLISSLHLQPTGPTSTTTTLAPLPEPPVAGMRQLPVGVGSPPLKGTLTLPHGKGPFPAVVLVSGSGPNNQDESNGPNRPFLDVAVGLAARGIATLRYDKRTLDYPASIDPRTFTPTDEYVPDALAAIRLLAHEPAINPHLIFVLGHSQGGTYAPLIAKDAPEVAGVVLLAAGAEPLGAAILRQTRYLATLPGTIGSQAERELPEITVLTSQMDDAAALEKDNPGMNILDGTSPGYYLSALRYDEVATARAVPQPLLLLQGGRDYQVTVANDLDAWLRGLKGRSGVTVVQFPLADHLLLDGTGPPTPLEYVKPGRIDPEVTPAIASWIERVASRLARSPALAGTPR
jgi:pimeloyl-ACP methyl ester carboxylesterase